MSADTVLLSYLHHNEPSGSFLESIERLTGFDLAHHARVVRGGVHRIRAGSGGLIDGRNKAISTFLDETTSDWIFIVDDDMGFAPDTVERLLASADPTERPVVGGLCFALKETAPDGMGGWHTMPIPTVYQWATDANGREGFTPRTCYPINSLVRVAGTGAACLLVHRSILETIRKAEGDAWFDHVINPSTGQRISEDLSFCYRVMASGSSVWVDTSVKTTHAKTVWLAESDYWMRYDASPATESVDVIVPVLHRPQNVKLFMESLTASTGLATAWFVCEPDDVIEWAEVEKHGGNVLAHSGSFAEKANHAYGRTQAPWLFLVGDDVKFRPGWLDHAQHIANTHQAHVVGTNDLGNPRVLAGEHATHILIRRSYADEQGASWDGPGVVCHEGYRHWYVDDEIVMAAKQRDAWAMAIGSIVEHLHPAWGKAKDDDVYQLGQQSADTDRAVFKHRMKAFSK